MGAGSWSLLARLRRAVNKIRLLLDYNMSRWKLASTMAASSSSPPSKRRALSFNDRPGLRAVMDDDDDEFIISETNNSPGSSSSSSSSSHRLQRTISSPSSEDDIDKRAEQFIENFYRQLKLERQISLELRYARASSFSSSGSP